MSAAFSTGSHAHQPPQPSSTYAQPPPRTSAVGEHDDRGSGPPGRFGRERNRRDQRERQTEIQQRWMDEHGPVFKDRTEARSGDRRYVEPLERRGDQRRGPGERSNDEWAGNGRASLRWRHGENRADDRDEQEQRPGRSTPEAHDPFENTKARSRVVNHQFVAGIGPNECGHNGDDGKPHAEHRNTKQPSSVPIGDQGCGDRHGRQTRCSNQCDRAHDHSAGVYRR